MHAFSLYSLEQEKMAGNSFRLDWTEKRKSIGSLTFTWRHHGSPSSRSEMRSSGRFMGKNLVLFPVLPAIQPQQCQGWSQDYSAEDNLQMFTQTGKNNLHASCLLLKNILNLYYDSFSPKDSVKRIQQNLHWAGILILRVRECVSKSIARFTIFQTEKRDIFWTSYASTENSSYSEYQIFTANCS